MRNPGFERGGAHGAVEALRNLIRDTSDAQWTHRVSTGSILSEYGRGQMDGLSFANDGQETRDRLYELARQFGYAPITGRVCKVADGLWDMEAFEDTAGDAPNCETC